MLRIQNRDRGLLQNGIDGQKPQLQRQRDMPVDHGRQAISVNGTSQQSGCRAGYMGMWLRGRGWDGDDIAEP